MQDIGIALLVVWAILGISGGPLGVVLLIPTIGLGWLVLAVLASYGAWFSPVYLCLRRM